MMNLNNVPNPLPSGNAWTEEKPPFAQQSTASWGTDFGSVVLNIKVDGSLDNLRYIISYIVGYSEVVFVAAGGVGFTLSRHTPAIHPAYTGLFATKILSVTGKGNRDTPGEGAIIAGQGVMGEYQYAYISILFEIPKYDILTDAQNSGQPEYKRYTTWEAEEMCEVIARKGVTWTFPNPFANAVQPAQNGVGKGTYNGDRLVRQAKSGLKVTTYDVARDFVFAGRIVPSNGLLSLSTVNSQPFPKVPYAINGLIGQYRPGTCLCMPSKYNLRAQANPAVMTGQVSAQLFPQTVDVERHFIIFDPGTDETMTTDLKTTNDLFGNPLNGQQWTPIRGHNLAPLVRASSTGYGWYAPCNLPMTLSPAAESGKAGYYYSKGVPQTSLTYQYNDHEKLWQFPLPMPTG
jgi:hypothetical protein